MCTRMRDSGTSRKQMKEKEEASRFLLFLLFVSRSFHFCIVSKEKAKRKKVMCIFASLFKEKRSIKYATRTLALKQGHQINTYCVRILISMNDSFSN